MQDIIYDLVKSNDLLEVSRIFKTIDENSAKKNRSSFYKNLVQTILEWTVVSRGDFLCSEKSKYYIHGPNKSIPPYLASHGLTPSNNVREIKKIIKKLTMDIDMSIVEPSGINLTMESLEKIMSVLSSKFPFWKIVSGDKTLDILNINNSHRLFNSICGISGDATTFYIFMFNMKDPDSIPEHSLLHELGHVLQIVLSGSSKLVPEEFLEFNKKVLNVTMKQGSIDAVETFADTFSIAVMYGTE